MPASHFPATHNSLSTQQHAQGAALGQCAILHAVAELSMQQVRVLVQHKHGISLLKQQSLTAACCWLAFGALSKQWQGG